MKTVAVIPSRLGSTRLPRKPLHMMAGLPMVGHVYQAASRCNQLAEVIIATDSEEILDVCRRHGWNARMTSSDHRSGTDRVHEISQTVAADVYVNVQGDEPLTQPEHIDALLEPMRRDDVLVSTIKTRCPAHDVSNPAAVKVVTSQDGKALYFSRATIPFHRDGEVSGTAGYFKHLGFYAYRKDALDAFHRLPESELERTERLEQLRFLDNGFDIYVAETPFDTVGVDTAEDAVRVAEILARRKAK